MTPLREIDYKLLILVERETEFIGTAPTTLIEDLEIDSLDFIELLQTIRAEIGEVDEKLAMKARTLGDLMAAIT